MSIAVALRLIQKETNADFEKITNKFLHIDRLTILLFIYLFEIDENRPEIDEYNNILMIL
jgi:hypothetical protein